MSLISLALITARAAPCSSLRAAPRIWPPVSERWQFRSLIFMACTLGFVSLRNISPRPEDRRYCRAKKRDKSRRLIPCAAVPSDSKLYV